MSEIGDDFKAMQEHYRKIRHDRVKHGAPPGWTEHSQWHWSRMLNGKRLDYWPSTQKFRYAGRTHQGDVWGFIRNREPQIVTFTIEDWTDRSRAPALRKGVKVTHMATGLSASCALYADQDRNIATAKEAVKKQLDARRERYERT